LPVVVILLEAKLEFTVPLKVDERCFTIDGMMRVVEHVLSDIPFPFVPLARSRPSD